MAPDNAAAGPRDDEIALVDGRSALKTHACETAVYPSDWPEGVFELPIRQQGLQGLHRIREHHTAQRIGHNKAAVALANKTARRLWAAEHHGTAFDHDHLSRQPR